MAIQPQIALCRSGGKFALLCAFGSILATPGAHGEDGVVVDNGAARTNACALLSPRAISQVIGFPVGAGIRNDSGYERNGSYSSTCYWQIELDKSAIGPDASLDERNFVILNVMRWPDGSGLAHTFLQAFHEAADRGEIPSRPVSRDFGDAALWWGDGLAVRKGDVSFGISVVMPGTDSSFPGEFEEQLAPKIVEQLDQLTE